MTTTIDPDVLAQFSGSTTVYAHWTKRLRFTEGVHYLTEHGCAWLVDSIAASQLEPSIASVQFQVWKLTVGEDSQGRLTCDDDERSVTLPESVRGPFFTDYRGDTLELWLINATLLLPSEY